MAKRVPFIHSFYARCTNATEQRFTLSLLGPQYLRCLQHVSVMNKTGAATALQLGLKRGSEDAVLGRTTALGGGKSYELTKPVYVPGDWQPYVAFVGATAADELYATFCGYVTEVADVGGS